MDKAIIEDRDSQYFKIIKFKDEYLLYANNIMQWKTTVAKSKDGINFDSPRMILEKSNACHNFSPFVVDDKVYAIGGQDDWKAREQEKKRKSHNCGLYLFESVNGIDFRLNDLIITAKNKGFVSSLGWKSAEFDSYLSITEKDNLYYIYLRANLAPGVRFIQYATSKDLIKWSKFKLINMDKKFKGNYYFANVENYNALVMFSPFFSDYYSCVKVYNSTNGHDWEFRKDILESAPVMIKDRNKKKKNLHVNWIPKSKIHPIGIVDDYFYYHNNYRGYNENKPVTIERIKLSEL